MKNISGIYIILNLIDCKVYVGQSKDFSNRTHSTELFNGNDNSNINGDYNSGAEFVYFAVVFNNEFYKQQRNQYEKLFMTILEDFGFELYNIALKRNEREFGKLGITEEEKVARVSIEKDFIKRFGFSPTELVEMNKEKRISIFESYLRRRLEADELGKELAKDFVILSTARIKTLFGKTRKFEDIEKDELFFSKVGSYIGEGIEIILNYENEAIKEHGYCLWTFGAGQVDNQTVQKLCIERESLNKETYVLFDYTPSPRYAYEEPFTYNRILLKNNKFLTEEMKLFLGLSKDDNGDLSIPKSINSTSASKNSCLAFVIQDFFFIEEGLNFDELRKSYDRVNKGNIISQSNKHYLGNTSFCRINESKYAKSNLDVRKNSPNRFQFLAKLVSPYIVRLDSI